MVSNYSIKINYMDSIISLTEDTRNIGEEKESIIRINEIPKSKHLV